MSEALTPHLSRLEYVKGYLHYLQQEEANINFNYEANTTFQSTGQTLGTALDESKSVLGLPARQLQSMTALKYKDVVQDSTTAVASLSQEELAFAYSAADILIPDIKQNFNRNGIKMETILFKGYIAGQLAEAKRTQNIAPFVSGSNAPGPGGTPASNPAHQYMNNNGALAGDQGFFSNLRNDPRYKSLFEALDAGQQAFINWIKNNPGRILSVLFVLIGREFGFLNTVKSGLQLIKKVAAYFGKKNDAEWLDWWTSVVDQANNPAVAAFIASCILAGPANTIDMLVKTTKTGGSLIYNTFQLLTSDATGNALKAAIEGGSSAVQTVGNFLVQNPGLAAGGTLAAALASGALPLPDLPKMYSDFMQQLPSGISQKDANQQFLDEVEKPEASAAPSAKKKGSWLDQLKGKFGKKQTPAQQALDVDDDEVIDLDAADDDDDDDELEQVDSDDELDEMMEGYKEPLNEGTNADDDYLAEEGFSYINPDDPSRPETEAQKISRIAAEERAQRKAFQESADALNMQLAMAESARTGKPLNYVLDQMQRDQQEAAFLASRTPRTKQEIDEATALFGEWSRPVLEGVSYVSDPLNRMFRSDVVGQYDSLYYGTQQPTIQESIAAAQRGVGQAPRGQFVRGLAGLNQSQAPDPFGTINQQRAYYKDLIGYRDPNIATNSSGGGLKHRAKNARKPIVRGRGLYYPVGEGHYIDMNKLDKGYVNIKNSKFKQIGKQEQVGGNLASAVKTVLKGKNPKVDDVEPLDDSERGYLNKLGKLTGEGNFHVPLKNKTAEEKEIHQFEVMKGEIIAGNDNKEMIADFKRLLLKLMKNHRINKKEGSDILIELAALGY